MDRNSRQPELAPLRQILRETMATEGCPLCRIAARAELAFIDSLNYERVLDLTTRDALKASRGLCAHHSRVWQRVQGAALGIAIVYRISVLDLLRDTEPGGHPRGLRFLRRGQAAATADLLEARAPCPACSLGEETAARYGGLLLGDLGQAEVQSLFVGCGGLCLPHLRQALRLPRAEPVREQLLDAQRRAWQRLMGDLEEFIRKNDYRFTDEVISPAEAKSWTRALDALVGLGDALDSD